MPLPVALPADLEEIVCELDAISRQAANWIETNPAAVLEQSPGPEQWSVAQCLAHLAMTNLKYISAMRSAVTPALHFGSNERTGAISPGVFTRWFLGSLEPPVRRRFRAFGAILPPASIEAHAALKSFLASQRAVEDLLLECRTLDLNRIRFQNPFLPALRFSVGGGFLIIAAHDRRHLWQAAEVLRVVAPSNR